MQYIILYIVRMPPLERQAAPLTPVEAIPLPNPRGAVPRMRHAGCLKMVYRKWCICWVYPHCWWFEWRFSSKPWDFMAARRSRVAHFETNLNVVNSNLVIENHLQILEEKCEPAHLLVNFPFWFLIFYFMKKCWGRSSSAQDFFSGHVWLPEGSTLRNASWPSKYKGVKRGQLSGSLIEICWDSFSSVTIYPT